MVDTSGEDMDENTAWFSDTWVEGNFIVEMWSLCRVVAGWRLESLRRLDYGSYETVLRVFWSNFANFARIIVYLIPVIIFSRVLLQLGRFLSLLRNRANDNNYYSYLFIYSSFRRFRKVRGMTWSIVEWNSFFN